MTALTIAGTAMAQNSTLVMNSADTASVRSITLPQAINIALKNNYQIKKAKNSLELADMNRKNAEANFFPSLSGNLRSTRNIGKQFNEVTGNFANQTTNNISGGVSANITIFSGLQNIYNLRQSDQSQLSQKEQLRQQRQDIIFNTASSYLKVLLDQQLLEIDQENVKSSQSQLDQVKAEVQVGSRPIADQYNQESTVAQNQLTVIQQQNQLDIDKLSLIRQLQLNPLSNYTFVRPALDTMAVQNASIPDLQTMISKALENRSDIQSQQHVIQANYFNMKRAESQRYPTLSFSAGISGSYYDTYRLRELKNPNDPTSGYELTKVGFGQQFFNQNVSKQLGFNLSIPIFNRLNTTYQIQSSEINYRNSKLDLENMRLNVIQEIRQAYNDYKNYAEQLKSTKVALISAQKAYETQRERYKVGAGTLVELTQANAQYVQAQSNRQQALYRFIFQEQLINYYMGQISANMKIKALNFNN